jgi:hypothetical protein
MHGAYGTRNSGVCGRQQTVQLYTVPCPLLSVHLRLVDMQ